jgi:hypothetical protein
MVENERREEKIQLTGGSTFTIAKGEPYTGNPYVQFDEGTEVERPPPTLRT